MNIASRRRHQSSRDCMPVTNTHCAPQAVVQGRKTPQRAICKIAILQTDRAHGVEWDNRSGLQSDLGQFPFEYLIGRIIHDQHEEIRHELIRLQGLSALAANQEPPRQTGLKAVRQLLRSFVARLTAHMNEEEEIFPYLLQLELAYLGEDVIPRDPTRAREALQTFSKEHGIQLRILTNLCSRADSAGAPSEIAGAACDLSCALKDFHRTLFNHSHLETNAVFARAAQMEEEISPG